MRAKFLIERDHVPPEHPSPSSPTPSLYITGRSMVRTHQVALSLDWLMGNTSVCSKSHHPDLHHGDPDIWQGIVCRWSAGRKKYRVPDLVCHETTHTPDIDAKSQPEAFGSDVTGVGKATSGSLTDKLTREHRLTLDEAHMILNSKKEDSLEQILAVRAKFPVMLPALIDEWWPRCAALRASVQTEFSLGSSHSFKTSRRKACSGEVSLALPSVKGFPCEGTYRSGTQSAEHAIGTGTPTPTRIGTANPITSPLTMLYRRPHVYHIPSLITIIARRSEGVHDVLIG